MSRIEKITQSIALNWSVIVQKPHYQQEDVRSTISVFRLYLDPVCQAFAMFKQHPHDPVENEPVNDVQSSLWFLERSHYKY